MKKLYFFDFDGTLTQHDTMFLFLKFYNSKKYHVQYLKHVPLFILLKLKLADAEKVKKSFVGSILKGQSEERITTKAQQFFDKEYPKLIRTNALDFIQNIDRSATESYLVTASLDIWVRPFAKQFNMNLLATEAQFSNGIFTGDFITKNCNGEEKVFRIKKAIEGLRYDKSIAFGDTSGDKPMLSWADESYFRFFH